MELDGGWIDKTMLEAGNLEPEPDVLWAWGEWEAQSQLSRKLNAPDRRHPRFLWKPIYKRKPHHAGLYSTDPFIFGDRFLYSHCRQARCPVLLQRLARGSVIAFGSVSRDGWMLDTVLVVDDSTSYEVEEARNDLEKWVPDSFRDVTGGPLADNPDDHCGDDSCAGTGGPGSGRFRLYRGATPASPVDGMFSFFPAKLPAGKTGFARPIIDLPPEYFHPQSPAVKGRGHEPTAAELRAIWRCLVDQVLEKKCVLGTSAKEPRRFERIPD